MTRKVSADEFRKFIEQSNRQLIAVLFYAKYLPGCEEMLNSLQVLDNKFNYSVDFFTVDVDEEYDLKKVSKLTQFPAMVFFKPNVEQPIHIAHGLISERELIAGINDLLTKIAHNKI